MASRAAKIGVVLTKRLATAALTLRSPALIAR